MPRCKHGSTAAKVPGPRPVSKSNLFCSVSQLADFPKGWERRGTYAWQGEMGKPDQEHGCPLNSIFST